MQNLKEQIRDKKALRLGLRIDRYLRRQYSKELLKPGYWINLYAKDNVYYTFSRLKITNMELFGLNKSGYVTNYENKKMLLDNIVKVRIKSFLADSFELELPLEKVI